jgi:membrane associated rhomboid family serine protease
MPRSAGLLAFPEFSGFTRQLILWNLGAYFFLLLLGVASGGAAFNLVTWTALDPYAILHFGRVWQLVTYSFVHQGILNTAFELLSIWFLASFLEGVHGSRWLAELYFFSVIGAGLAAIALSLALPSGGAVLAGCFGGIFGLLIAFGVLYGEQQFMMFPLPMMIRAKYLVWVYMLITLAMLFSSERAFAFAQLGGALFGYIYIKFAPRRGFALASSERYFGFRNGYYRWKRRRAARKFEVYMRKQNRDVSFDKDGRYIDPDKDPNDRRWMN